MNELIYIVDDDEGIRESLKALLESKQFSVSSHSSSEEFLARFRFEEALCVIADLRMSGLGGLELQQHLIGLGVNIPFIMITGFGDVPSAVRALKAGATDFIEKPIDSMAFLNAVEKAVAARRNSRSSDAASATARQKLNALTPREQEILQYMIKGAPNKIIAHKLGISTRTVENHRARLMVRLQVDSLAELLSLALNANFQVTSEEDDQL